MFATLLDTIFTYLGERGDDLCNKFLPKMFGGKFNNLPKKVIFIKNM